MLIEVICETVDDAKAAVEGGADRLEVLANLEAEGLSPSAATVAAIARAVSVPVRVMLRHRADLLSGDAAAVENLIADGRRFREAGAQAVVLGFTSLAGTSLDFGAVRQVLAGVGGPATFHRAFEWAGGSDVLLREIEKQHPEVDVVMTSGGSGTWPERATKLRALQDAAARVAILPAGGLDATGVAALAAAGLRQAHLGVAVRTPASHGGRVDARRVAVIREAAGSESRGALNA